MKKILSAKLIETSIDLSEFGMNTLIWDARQIYNVLIEVENMNKYVVLGGDIYKKDNGRYMPTGDGWYYNGVDIKDSLKRSRDYLDNYSQRNGNDFLTGLVVKEI